jgi:hypothetical protein
MSGLSSRAQAFVDSMQFSDEPSAADFERVHSAITARIAVGAAAGAIVLLGAEAAASAAAAPMANGTVAVAQAAQAVAAGSVAAGTAAAPVAGGGAAALGITSTAAIAAKVAAWAVAIGLTGGAVSIMATRRADSRAPSPAITQTISPNSGSIAGRQATVASSGVRAISDHGSPTRPSGGPGDPRSVPSEEATRPEHEPGARAGVSAVLPGAAGAQTEVEPPRDAPTLDVELALMRKARTALNDGHPEEALAALDEHALRFPKGVLAEDRAAQRVLALCALPRLEAAREDGQRFISNYPRSPHVAAIRSSCAFAREQGNNGL